MSILCIIYCLQKQKERLQIGIILVWMVNDFFASYYMHFHMTKLMNVSSLRILQEFEKCV